MPGLDFSHAVGQALEAGKLFHIDLNGQKPGRYDQDLRFASEDQKGAFFLVKLLEDAKWPGMRHFDSHAYRTEDERACGTSPTTACAPTTSSRRRWRASTPTRRFSSILKSLREMSSNLGRRGIGSNFKYSEKTATALKAHDFDLGQLRAQGLRSTSDSIS